ncbi:hypothetical protein D031_1368B, partial [Vibrio parahaemolyticus VP-48]
VRGSHVP